MMLWCAHFILVFIFNTANVACLNVYVDQQNYTAMLGEPFTLTCQIENAEAVLIKYGFWIRTKNDRNITFFSDQSFPITHTIAKVGFNDGGAYTCGVAWEEKNSNGTVKVSRSQPVILFVIEDLPTVVIPFQEYHVGIGHRVTLQCKVTAHSEIKEIRWEGNDWITKEVTSSNRTTGGSIKTPSLTILKAAKNDSGSYLCCAINAVASFCSNYTFLNVTGDQRAPIVYTQDASLSKHIWEKLTINCSIETIGDLPVTEVYWEKNNSGVIDRITAGLKGITGSVINNPSLTIESVTVLESGFYTCLAKNNFGVGRSQKVLVKVVGDIPDVRITRKHISSSYGNTETIECMIDSYPPVIRVYWMHSHNGFIRIINYGSVRTQGVSPGRPSLTLEYVTRMDSGNYTCYATNFVGTGKSSFSELKVLGEIPKVTVGLIEVKVKFGNALVLHCAVESFPTHYDVFWQKNTSGRVTIITRQSFGEAAIKSLKEPSLNVPYATTTDSGQYKCFAENAVGIGASTIINVSVVGGLPNVSIGSNKYKTIYGEPITLECYVTADPQTNLVYWIRNTSNIKSIISHGTFGTKGISLNNASLVLTFPMTVDSGSYTCCASNIIGLQSSELIILDVIGGKPKVTSSMKEYKALYKEKVTLPCIVSAVPFQEKVYWFKTIRGLQQVIHEGDNGIDGSSPGSPSLTINNITVADEGTYICGAMNKVGKGESPPIQITVNAAIPVLKVKSEQLTTGLGFSLTISCSIQSSIPKPTQVYWQRYSNGQRSIITSDAIGYSGVALHDPSLTILYITESMSGEYTCFASNDVGTGNSLPIVLKVVTDLLPDKQESTTDNNNDSDRFVVEVVLGSIGVIGTIVGAICGGIKLYKNYCSDTSSKQQNNQSLSERREQNKAKHQSSQSDYASGDRMFSSINPNTIEFDLQWNRTENSYS